MKTVSVRVKAGCKRQSLEQEGDGTLTARLKSPPIEGRANRELIELLSERFAVPKSRIRIRSGASSRLKLIEVGD